MEFGFGFGIGWALGIVFGIHLSRVCWPDNNESIWDRRIREQNMVKKAVHIARQEDAIKTEDVKNAVKWAREQESSKTEDVK